MSEPSPGITWLPPGDRTPNGGVAHQIVFFDKDGNPLPSELGAVSCEIHELDAAGNSIYRTYATLSPTGDTPSAGPAEAGDDRLPSGEA